MNTGHDTFCPPSSCSAGLSRGGWLKSRHCRFLNCCDSQSYPPSCHPEASMTSFVRLSLVIVDSITERLLCFALASHGPGSCACCGVSSVCCSARPCLLLLLFVAIFSWRRVFKLLAVFLGLAVTNLVCCSFCIIFSEKAEYWRRIVSLYL